MKPRVLFYVQHLLGIGHVKRATLLNAALVEHGFEVLVVLGGRDVPGLAFDGSAIVRLPTAHVADHTFTPLLNADGAAVDAAWKQRRTQQLVQTFQDFKPDLIVTEMFPFGRRQFRFELIPLLQAARAARPRPVIVSSVRDILVKKSKPGRDRETADFVREHFDLVLVHGDPNLTPLDATFPEAKSIADLIRYTGYIAPAPQPDNENTGVDDIAGVDEVIVSAGGGAVGDALFTTALAARAKSTLANKTWRFVTGLNLAPATYLSLTENAPDGVIIDRFRPDLPHMLRRCALSISQGGYNTIMDILRARCKAVIVPYGDGGENEQHHRAKLLARQNVLTMLKGQALSPAALAEAIDTAAQGTTAPTDIDLAGPHQSAELLLNAIANRPKRGHRHD